MGCRAAVSPVGDFCQRYLHLVAPERSVPWSMEPPLCETF